MAYGYFGLTLIFVIFVISLSFCKPLGLGLRGIVSRERWHAKPATAESRLETPVQYVVIHHSSEPPACHTPKECAANMRIMQCMHQDGNGWADIGYNFAVGGDGLAYEGRGWARVGAHAQGYNSRSIGIVLIGNFVSELPPKQQLETAKQLIAKGVREGFISGNYSLVGHKQVRDTECPGDALYKEIAQWKNFNAGTVFTSKQDKDTRDEKDSAFSNCFNLERNKVLA